MSRSALRRLALVLMALALFSAACGGSDESAADPDPDVATDTSAETLSSAPDVDTDSGTDTDAEPGDLDGCEPLPSFSEGAFYVEAADRSDLTDGLPADAGVGLQLRLTVLDAETCTPLSDLPVEVWGAAPDGRYSGVSTQPDGMGEPALDEDWLRGQQQTDADGTVDFATLMPGWIPGHAPHVHLTIPIDDARSFTARLLLPDDVTSDVYAQAAYTDRGTADVTAAMEIERDLGVERSLIELTPLDEGYRADVIVVVSEAELRGRPRSAIQSTEAPQDEAGDALLDGPVRTFDQLGGELQEMFSRAGADLGIDPEALYEEFRFVTSEEPPDLPAIADRLGVTQDALALALPLLAGGAPTPGGTTSGG